jgi:signal transduction histidine kinase
MILFLLQILCSLLFATGLLFTLVDLRTHYDKSFRYFGLSLIFLSMIAGIDLWISPVLRGPEEQLYWQRVLHVLACGFTPFSFAYLCILMRTNPARLLRIMYFSSLVLACLFFSGPMLGIKAGKVSGGPLYYALFFPYAFLYISAAGYLILFRFRKSQAAEKRILRFHMIGFLILCVSGVLDMMGVANPSAHLFPSFKIFGILAFGIMATMIFVERFLILLKERDSSFTKLESAYRDLEQVNALKQLGESTAIINHEIKNYMFMISGNAQILAEMENLSDKGRGIVHNIVSSVERLTDFSDDILRLSRTQILKEKHPINLTQLIRGTIEKHYPGRQRNFTLLGCERDQFIFGDWGKLEQVFVNLFNNAFEAGGEGVEVKVKLTAGPSLLLVGVEDNGAGCDKEQLESLFRAFYTTKKSQGGTGLGMSITRTIVESHGGKISAYSKNLARKGDHGLKLIMTFPLYAENMAEALDRKHPIVLVKSGMDNLPDLIRVFQNVKVTPYIVQDADALNETDFPPETFTVLVGAKAMAEKFTRLSVYPRLCLVSHHERNLYVLDYGRGNRPDVFSEEYVITRLLPKATPRARLRERQHLVV